MDIDHLLRCIRAGDRNAFAPVVARYQHALFRFLGNMGLRREEAEDLAQEAFIRAWRNLGQYDPTQSQFSTWLLTIARNLALKQIAQQSGRAEPFDEQMAEHLHCERAPPPEALETEQRRLAVHAAIRQLPTSDRSVLALAYLRDLDMEQIAIIECCSVGAVKTRLHRARNRLSQLLEPQQ